MIEALLDTAPAGYFAFKDAGNLLMVNQTLANVLNYTKEELTGKDVESIFTIPTRIFFQTHLFPLVKMHGYAEEIFISLLTKKGKNLPVLLNAKRMEWNQEMITCCSFIEMPHRKKFEDELVAARNSAEKALRENTELLKAQSDLQLQAESLEEHIRMVQKQNLELKQFSRVVTHNLKEPLRKILVYSSRLHEEGESPIVDKLFKANEQMKAVVSGLQEFVWLTEKDNIFKDVDLNLIVQHAAEQLEKEGHTSLISLHYDKLLSLEGDAEQLQVLFYHLLSNAIRFRKNNIATVHINTTIVKQNKFRSVKNKYQYDDFVKIEVHDEGIGFDPAYREHIFELFRKLHNKEGQGLGLALCKNIAGNHNGFIEAESQAGEFTKIKVWLPLRQI
jgi:sigma-B regulation protein RsbU (phosphoserine phosphatase)